MNLHNELLTRMKRTWEMIRPSAPPHKPPRNADHLVKLNFPPLLGRRDAAYDHVCMLIGNEELFGRDEAWRRKHYSTIKGLLESAADDTRAILQTLSSPDTARREQELYDLITLLLDIVGCLGEFVRVGNMVLADTSPAATHFGIRYSDTDRARGERLLSEVEISSVSQLRVCCTRGLPKIARYREYTVKNLSKSNLSRYRKSYEAYAGIFREAAGAQ